MRLPSWVVIGAEVVVKATAGARQHGIPTVGQFARDNDRAWPGERGQIHENRPGCYSVWFSGGREVYLGSVADGPSARCAAFRPT